MRTSGTERMSRALSLLTGTGVKRGAAGVKTAKLLGGARSNRETLECGQHKFSGRLLKGVSNCTLRGMFTKEKFREAFLNRIRLIVKLNNFRFVG
jgi:hypothetical protein